MPSHWTINGRFLSQPLTGVQRYARQVVAEMDSLLSENPALARRFTVELLVPPDSDIPPPLKAITVREAGPLTGHLWEQLILPFQAVGRIINLCNTGPVFASGQILCIHDLNTRVYPQSYSRAFRLLYQVLTPILVRRAGRIVTVSHFSASLLREHGLGGEDTVVIPNGHEHVLRWKPRHTPETAAAAGPDTIVLLGSNAPHKNVRLILGLADRLAREGFRIALAGSCDRRVFAESSLNDLPENVMALGRLQDDALAALLKDSLCLAFPSYVEGFGLPPLEAMSLGCPVVSSDRTSLPEVCGAAALYADPDRPDEWMAAFRRLRDEPALRQTLVELGFERARNFSWRGAAHAYIELMARLSSVPVTMPLREPAEIA